MPRTSLRLPQDILQTVLAVRIRRDHPLIALLRHPGKPRFQRTALAQVFPVLQHHGPLGPDPLKILQPRGAAVIDHNHRDPFIHQRPGQSGQSFPGLVGGNQHPAPHVQPSFSARSRSSLAALMASHFSRRSVRHRNTSINSTPNPLTASPG